MELTQEQIAEIGLSEEQLPKLKTLVETHVADLKKEWDGKANENAEKIIQGAADKVESLTGIKREQGQKLADYLSLAGENYFKGTKSALEQKERDLDRKLKEGGGDAALKTELEKVKNDLDILKQKEAQFADWEKNDYKGKYEETTQKMTQMELRVAFSNVKPSFPDTVNQYEAKAKWDEFQKNVTTTYNIKLNDEGEAIAVDKTNEYKIVKLADLVKTDKTISELAKGRAATGLGSGQKQNTTVEGVPFQVPENATSEERSKAIKEYLTGTLNLAVTSQDYAKKFAEYNAKLLEKTPKK
jgi:hypothetical protein